jgi:hypothetical protein
MNTYLFYVQLIFSTDMLAVIGASKNLWTGLGRRDVEQTDSKVCSTQEIRLSVSQIAVLDKGKFLFLF